MFLSQVPSQGGMEGAVQLHFPGSEAAQCHSQLPAPGSSQKMSPQRFPVEPEGGH